MNKYIKALFVLLVGFTFFNSAFAESYNFNWSLTEDNVVMSVDRDTYCPLCPQTLSDLNYDPSIQYPPGSEPVFTVNPGTTMRIRFSVVNTGTESSLGVPITLYLSPLHNDINPTSVLPASKLPLPRVGFISPPTSTQQVFLYVKPLMPGEKQDFVIVKDVGPFYNWHDPKYFRGLAFLVIDIGSVFNMQDGDESDNRVSIPLIRAQ